MNFSSYKGEEEYEESNGFFEIEFKEDCDNSANISRSNFYALV